MGSCLDCPSDNLSGIGTCIERKSKKGTEICLFKEGPENTFPENLKLTETLVDQEHLHKEWCSAKKIDKGPNRCLDNLAG